MPASPPRYPVPHEPLQARRPWLVRVAGRAYMRLFGWRFAGAFPEELKFVCIVAPHTSNWDFFLGLAVLFSTDLKVSFLGKHSIFRWPVEGLLKRLGGIPVDRSAASGVVGQTVGAFQGVPALMLALAPEGTRKGESRWKSGFHAIATGAGVPIFPVAFDFGTRLIRFMPVFHPTADYEADLAALQAMYAGVKGQRERIPR